MAAPRTVARRVGLRQRNYLATFRPSEAFAEFVHDTSGQVFVRAANGTGKTRHGCYKLAKAAIQQKITARWVGPSRAQVRDVAAKYLWEFLQPYCAPGSYYKPGIGFNRNGTIVLRNGSEIQLKSYQDEPDTHEGANLDVVALDEPPTQAHYRANLSRVGRNAGGLGQILVLFTAVNRPVQWFRREVEGDEDSPSAEHGMVRRRHASGWVQYVIPYRYEYVRLWQSPEAYQAYVAKFEGTMQYAQRIEAAWEGTVHDRVMASFGIHCLAPLSDLAELSFDEIRLGLDHGKGFGKQVSVVVGVVHDGRAPSFYLLGEHLGEGSTSPDQDAQAILELLGALGLDLWDVDHAYGDIGLGGREDPSSGDGGGRWNEFIEASLARLVGYDQCPVSIRTPHKRRKAPRAGLAALDHACKEGRFKAARECRQFIRSAMAFTGKEEDLKDVLDAVRYSVQDLLLGPRGERVAEWSRR